ncbi:MAG: DUF4197 family protein, partial [Pseudomonadota bacterium]
MSKHQQHLSSLTRRHVLTLALGPIALAACTAAEQEALLGAVLAQSGQGGSSAAGLSNADAAAGVRAALQNGIGAAISQVGRRNGYFLDNLIRIPLPGFLADAQGTLSRLGLSGA